MDSRSANRLKHRIFTDPAAARRESVSPPSGAGHVSYSWTGLLERCCPESLGSLVEVNTVACDHGLPVIVSTHPRTRSRIDEARRALSKLRCALQAAWFPGLRASADVGPAVLSDSGTITEESSILNFPALNLRETHERPEGHGGGADDGRAGGGPGASGARILANQPGGETRIAPVADYGMPNVSTRSCALSIAIPTT